MLSKSSTLREARGGRLEVYGGWEEQEAWSKHDKDLIERENFVAEILGALEVSKSLEERLKASNEERRLERATSRQFKEEEVRLSRRMQKGRRKEERNGVDHEGRRGMSKEGEKSR
eukprot:763908-Hanusia_phi.AAC.6